MSVPLTPQAEDLSRERLATGPDRSAEEVIEEALRLLEARDRRVQELRASVAEAEEFERRGVPLNPDVCP